MLTGWLRRHDPELYAVHRSVRLAVTVTGILALSQLIGAGPDQTTFSVFGTFGLLLFVDSPGSRSARFGGYLMLGVVGSVLVTLGTIAAGSVVGAIIGMAAVGFAVVFSGVLSAASAAATRSALLTFVLPVSLPSTPSDIGPRLLGWGLAWVIAVPLAL